MTVDYGSVQDYGRSIIATRDNTGSELISGKANSRNRFLVLFNTTKYIVLCVALVALVSIQFYRKNERDENGVRMDKASGPKCKDASSISSCFSNAEHLILGAIVVRAWNFDYVNTSSIRSVYPFFNEDDNEEVIMVEPQRITNFAVDNENDDIKIFNYSWSLKLQDGGGAWDSISGVTPAKKWNPSGITEPVNRTFSLTFPSPGTYSLTLSYTLPSDTVEERIYSVKCFYVRRELRQMTLRDRNTFLDTILTMKKTPTHMGVKLYGCHYRSLTDFQIVHVHAAGNRGSDKIHDGLGFMTQHLAMMSEFELSMQSVVPFMAMPYWDFTIDSVYIETHFGIANISRFFLTSELFTSNWFGRTEDRLHTVVEGRMGYLEIPQDFNFTVRSAYGFLRAPWNINPNKYITRYHAICGANIVNPALPDTFKADLTWPTCASHFKMSNSELMTSWYEWAWNISYLPHGPVHAWIGGMGGACDSFENMYDAGWITKYQMLLIKHNAFIFLKDGWHDFVIETPEYCSSDSASKCMWVCADDIANNTDAQKLLREYGNIRRDHPYYEQIVRKIFCETAWWPGDHMEAASPTEASFWPMHPTLDRLFQYKDLVMPFKNKDWVITDESIYCRFPAGTTDCKGHHAYDLTFFRTVMKDTSGEYKVQFWTNEEVRNAALPVTGTYMLPYVYNTFEWSHCKEVGVDFKTVVPSAQKTNK